MDATSWQKKLFFERNLLTAPNSDFKRSSAGVFRRVSVRKLALWYGNKGLMKRLGPLVGMSGKYELTIWNRHRFDFLLRPSLHTLLPPKHSPV